MQTYFVEPETSVLPKRYFLLSGDTVVKVLASRPDGKEIARPYGVKPYMKPENKELSQDSFKYYSYAFSRKDLDRGRNSNMEKLKKRIETKRLARESKDNG